MTTRAKKDKADFAEVEIHSRIRVRIHANGTQEIVRATTHIDPPHLTRHLRPDEREPGQGPWWEGGVAILDPKYASNGHKLVSKAREAADSIELAIRRAVSE